VAAAPVATGPEGCSEGTIRVGSMGRDVGPMVEAKGCGVAPRLAALDTAGCAAGATAPTGVGVDVDVDVDVDVGTAAPAPAAIGAATRERGGWPWFGSSANRGRLWRPDAAGVAEPAPAAPPRFALGRGRLRPGCDTDTGTVV